MHWFLGDFLYNCILYLQINGKHISWRHLEELYHAKTALSSRPGGLYLLKKIKLEHLKLTSFSRMRVDLAAQVNT